MSWLHLTSPSLQTTLAHVERYLETIRKQMGPTRKLALVFDIDDTVMLDNGPNKRQTVLAPMRDLFHKAKRLNYGVFFITARPDRNGNYSATKTQLKSMGFTDYDQLFLMPPQFRQQDRFSEFKYLMRHKIEQDGWTIVLNCGDSLHDLLVLPESSATPGKAATVLKKIQSLPSDHYVLFSPPENNTWCCLKMPTREKSAATPLAPLLLPPK